MLVPIDPEDLTMLQGELEKRLRRTLTPDEREAASGLLEEAALLVDSYLTCEATITDPRVALVVSRVAARTLEQAPAVTAGYSQQSEGAGPFQTNFGIPAVAQGGGAWLSTTDRQLLAKVCPGRGFASIPLASERG